MSRESMEYDVVIIGGGPSGLSTAIKLKQLDPNLNVCLLGESPVTAVAQAGRHRSPAPAQQGGQPAAGHPPPARPADSRWRHPLDLATDRSHVSPQGLPPRRAALPGQGDSGGWRWTVPTREFDPLDGAAQPPPTD